MKMLTGANVRPACHVVALWFGWWCLISTCNIDTVPLVVHCTSPNNNNNNNSFKGGNGLNNDNNGSQTISPEVYMSIVPQTPNKVTHYSMIGFEAHTTPEEVMNFWIKYINHRNTKIFPATTEGYEIVHLPTGSGATLWGLLKIENDETILQSMDPHFTGPSRVYVKVMEKKYDDIHDEGAIVGKAYHERPTEDDDEDNAEDRDDFLRRLLSGIQLEFYCPAHNLRGKDLNVPTICRAQIAAFTHWVYVFDSTEEWEEWNSERAAEGGIKFSDRSFTMKGYLMKAKDDDEEEKTVHHTEAIFSGHVLQSDAKINDETGEIFYWALVETLNGCQFDVVIHPRLVESAPPRPGSIIFGEFWLSGCLLDEE